MKDNKEVVPIIVNGELNTGEKKKKVVKIEEPPRTNGKLGNIVLTILALLLIVYGVSNIMNGKEEVKEEENNINSNIPEDTTISINDYARYFTFDLYEYNSIFTKEDISNMINGEVDSGRLSNNAILAIAAKNTKSYSMNGKEYILEKDLGDTIEKLFGMVNYSKERFNYYGKEYSYNQETRRYYVTKYNITKAVYETNTKIDINNDIVNIYVSYVDNTKTKAYTLAGVKLDTIVDKDNIDGHKDKLKYYSLEFMPVDSKYTLKSISIK